MMIPGEDGQAVLAERPCQWRWEGTLWGLADGEYSLCLDFSRFPWRGKGSREDVKCLSSRSWTGLVSQLAACELDWGRGDCAPGQGRRRLLLRARAQQRPRLQQGLQIALRCPALKISSGNKPKPSPLCFLAPLGSGWKDRRARLFGSSPSMATAPRAALGGASLLPGTVSVHHGLGRRGRGAGGWKYFISGRNP